MARRIIVFDSPDRFVTGTVGQPGNRTFYLQARAGERIVSVVIEKVQAALLADRMAVLLAELARRGLVDDASRSTGSTPGSAGDSGPLDEPLNELFRAGTLTLGWDASAGAVVVEAREETEARDEEAAEPAEYDDDDPSGPDLVRVRLPAALARAFVTTTVRAVASGRPPCPMCGQPLDPTGHLCPRRNGGARLN